MLDNFETVLEPGQQQGRYRDGTAANNWRGQAPELPDGDQPRGAVRPHPTDRRGLLVRLTPAGLGLADEAVARRLAGAQAIEAGLNASDQQTLVKLLQKLLGSAEILARAP